MELLFLLPLQICAPLPLTQHEQITLNGLEELKFENEIHWTYQVGMHELYI